MFFKEGLPPKQRETKAMVEGAGLITSTINCPVKVFTKTVDGKYKRVMHRSLKAVDDVKNIAIKKTKVVKQTSIIPEKNREYLKPVVAN